MICLMPKPSKKKNSEITEVFYDFHQAYTLSLKTASEEEWNKMSEEFILKVCKSFQSHVDTISEKKLWP